MCRRLIQNIYKIIGHDDDINNNSFYYFITNEKLILLLHNNADESKIIIINHNYYLLLMMMIGQDIIFCWLHHIMPLFIIIHEAQMPIFHVKGHPKQNLYYIANRAVVT